MIPFNSNVLTLNSYFCRNFQPIKSKYDIVIIGGGLGGLLCATMLSMEGYSVCVIDKNKQIGGNLQTFVRDKKIFDTGVHYCGGLSEGQNLHQIFKYVGIIDELKLKKMDKDFDQISFDGNQSIYKLAQGYENFIEQLSTHFPKERTAINTFINDSKSTCSKFPLYHLQAKNDYEFFNDFLSIGAQDYINQLTQNPELRAVLSGNNMLYAGNSRRTPYYVMALSMNTFIESAYKCINGGSQIAKELVKKIRINGGEILRNLKVEKINVENRIAKSIELSNGERIEAQHFISNIHPIDTIDLLETTSVRKIYANRVRALEDTIGVFSVYLTIKPNKLPFMNYNIYHYNDLEVWNKKTNYDEKDWPQTYMISSSPNTYSMESNFANCLTIMAYMKYEEVAQWQNTFNTVLHKDERGNTYEAFKQQKAALILDKVEQRIPGLKAAIENVYTSSPLSYRDYIGSPTGSAYGVERDYNAPWKTAPNPKTNISNLYFTGQNLVLHGILGVSIGSILTSSQFIGKEYLVNKINKA